jgi:V/A-type H+-transporting ATPase subunit D
VKGGPATRQTLLTLRARRARVERGVGLLRRRREALVTELFRLARPAVEARAAIAQAATLAWPPLLDALAENGAVGLRALAWPERPLEVEVLPRQIWGIAVAELPNPPSTARTPTDRGLPLAAAGPGVREVTERFETLTGLLLAAAAREALLRRLGEALSRTSRQVRSLEHRVTPELAAREAAIEDALDEREREERLRLRTLLDGRGTRRRAQSESGSVRPRS